MRTARQRFWQLRAKSRGIAPSITTMAGAYLALPHGDQTPKSLTGMDWTLPIQRGRAPITPRDDGAIRRRCNCRVGGGG